ncbi:hypothetical protein E0H51_27290 [Rhizobium leguminosarum bv. viciae]|nr:hypothetical protein [Rhizobium leguminosarum bv. viciae]TBY72064.1 hypothetical protein E0H51_27290 [Rhizobium leguminosarum bv. viciae]TBZ07288.1 hypothetical protein E0H38_30585 [Rhizobium leguminosarum bv. viciae]
MEDHRRVAVWPPHLPASIFSPRGEGICRTAFLHHKRQRQEWIAAATPLLPIGEKVPGRADEGATRQHACRLPHPIALVRFCGCADAAFFDSRSNVFGSPCPRAQGKD